MLPTRTILLTTTAALATAGLALLATGDSTAPSSATPGAEQGLVVFTSDRDGDNELYLRHGDGRLVQLTRNDADDHGGEWSPDGTRIAFVSDRDGDPELYVMGPDGGDVRQLTVTSTTPDGAPAIEGEPAWSPDGSRIAFTTTRDGGEYEIYVMAADGSGQTRLTHTEPWVMDGGPDWAPDGTELVFSSNRVAFDNTELYRMRADGTDVRRVTHTDAGVDENAPAWAPEGNLIAFSSNRTGTHDLYVMRPDGSGVRAVTGDPLLDDVFPRWTDRGDLVFWTFSHPSGMSSDVWTVALDGSGRSRLDASAAGESSPDAG